MNMFPSGPLPSADPRAPLHPFSVCPGMPPFVFCSRAVGLSPLQKPTLPNSPMTWFCSHK